MFLSLSGCKSTKFIFNYQLYDGIDYDGKIYHRVPYENMPASFEYNDFDLPVYIIDNAQKTRTDRIYYAAEIVGDEDHKYLFFDSSPFMRSDLFPLAK